MQADGDALWPAVSWEERHWEPATDVRDSFSPHTASSGPYRAAVPPAIAELPPQLIPATSSAADATAELIRFDTEFGQSAAGFEPLLVVAESAASSAIERVMSSSESIARAALEDNHEPSANQVVSHERAIEVALALSGGLSEDVIVQVQRALMASSRPDRRGRWRDQQVWIGGGSLGPQQASFVPPHESRIGALMHDLVRFMRRDDLPALAQIAVAHAQYETIHPFLEVNGRTGRAVMQAMLRRSDVTRRVTVPVSAGILLDTAGYFDAMTRYRAGKVEPIIEVFSQAAFTAVASSRQLLDELAAVRASWQTRSGARAGSGARRLIPLIERQPVINSRLAVEFLGVTAPNAQLAIDRLVSDGILAQVGSGRRNRVWGSPEILDALDAFAERSRRRR